MPLYIYRSSAGSGKTFTLVKEYLKIVLKNPYDFRHTLAITFTNKATGEMKHRVLKELREMSAGVITNMWLEVEREFSEQGTLVDIQKNATLTLENILFNYSRFEISTIDSFFTSIIRAFAKELKLPFNYNVDLDNKKALDYAVEKLYEDFGSNPDVALWLEEYVYNTVENDKGWNIEYQIQKLGEELFKEKFNALHQGGMLTIPELRKKVTQLKEIQIGFKKAIALPAQKAIALIEKSGLAFNYFKSGTANIFMKVVEGDFTLSKTFIKLANEEKETWCSQKSEFKEQIVQISDQLNRYASEVFEYREKHIRDFNSATEVLKNIYAYGLLSTLNEKVKDYRDEHNLMLIADSSFLIKEVVANQEAPFIFEKVGSQYKHILIDEFQDTSDFQWNNLMPLVINSLSNNCNVLIVGDVKQSIYRWRGGNMNLLLQKVQSDLKAFEEVTKVQDLKHNFRSSQNIVNFNNAFFETAKEILKNTQGFEKVEGGEIIEMAYEAVAQIPKIMEGGFVQVRFMDKEELEEGSQESEEDLKIWEKMALKETVASIQRCTSQGYQYSDILILLEKNSQVSVVSAFLSEQKIPFVSQNALLLKHAKPVKLLINLIRFLNDPSDQIAFSNVLWLNFLIKSESVPEQHDMHSFFFRKKDDEILEYLDRLPEGFMANYTGLKFKPVYELLQELLIIYDLNAANDPFLQRLLDLSLEQSAKGINSVAAFLEYWEEKKDELCIVTPSGINAVSLLTVHRSKGLEAPVVIVPFACFEMKPKTNSTFWADQLSNGFETFKVLPLNYTKSLAESYFVSAYYQEMLEGVLERLNVAYVGLTRPRERLYIFSEKFNDKNIGEPNTFNKLLYQVFSHNIFKYAHHWDSNNWTFSLGEELDRPSEDGPVQAPALFIPKNAVSSNYSSKIAIRSDADKFFTLLDTRQSENISMGHKLHAVLERLNKSSDLDPVLEDLMFEGKLMTKDIPSIKEKIMLLFQDPTFNSWFQPHWKVFTEREIFFNGNVYKPDRVIISSKETIVIDYKKNKPSDKYKQQVNRYADLLMKIGRKNVKKYLVYVENQVIEEVL